MEGRTLARACLRRATVNFIEARSKHRPGKYSIRSCSWRPEVHKCRKWYQPLFPDSAAQTTSQPLSLSKYTMVEAAGLPAST